MFIKMWLTEVVNGEYKSFASILCFICWIVSSKLETFFSVFYNFSTLRWHRYLKSFFTAQKDQLLDSQLINTPFTQGLRPLCLPCATTKLARSPLKAEGRPNGCLGCSRVVHRTFRHRHGRHGRREILSMFKTVAQRSPRRSVAHRSLKGGRMKAHTSPWSQNGCTVVGHLVAQ